MTPQNLKEKWEYDPGEAVAAAAVEKPADCVLAEISLCICDMTTKYEWRNEWNNIDG